MASVSESRHRIRSVKETQQITKAMHLISVSRLRKAIAQYSMNAVYWDKVRTTMKDILIHGGGVKHPFLQLSHKPGARTTFIIVTADKGLAGSYNHDVLKLAERKIQECEAPNIITVGSVGWDYFTHKGYMVDMEFMHVVQNPSLYNAQRIMEALVDLYSHGLMDEVYVIFTRLQSNVHMEPTAVRLLPVLLEDFADVAAPENHGNITYEPSPQEVLSILVPQYLEGMLYSMLVQSNAAEHRSRMLAMDTATRNADEMLEDLNQKYNQARQARITSELSDIIGGMQGGQ